MKSWEILKLAADEVGVKVLAARLKLSPALVYKWCQESSHEDPEASGTRNPLDRLAEIVELTGCTPVVSWLCHETGGFFVRNPAPAAGRAETELLKGTRLLVKEFSDLLSTVTRSIEDDGQIQAHEADLIREKWEQLKAMAEGFVVACEAGSFVEPQSR